MFSIIRRNLSIIAGIALHCRPSFTYLERKNDMLDQFYSKKDCLLALSIVVFFGLSNPSKSYALEDGESLKIGDWTIIKVVTSESGEYSCLMKRKMQHNELSFTGAVPSDLFGFKGIKLVYSWITNPGTSKLLKGKTNYKIRIPGVATLGPVQEFLSTDDNNIAINLSDKMLGILKKGNDFIIKFEVPDSGVVFTDQVDLKGSSKALSAIQKCMKQ